MPQPFVTARMMSTWLAAGARSTDCALNDEEDLSGSDIIGDSAVNEAGLGSSPLKFTMFSAISQADKKVAENAD